MVAHPDDESFTSAGTMWQNRLAGGKNYIICATYGEKGSAHLKKPVTQRMLKKIRGNELRQVAKFLKIDGLYFFNLPDTKVSSKTKIFLLKTLDVIKKLKPDYIFSFGPDGISGHLDHIAAGKVAKMAAKKLKIPFLAFGASPAIRNRFEQIKARRKHGRYAKNISHPAPNTKVKINLKIKRSTLDFHKSQFGQSTMFADMPKALKKGFMDYEYFIK